MQKFAFLPPEILSAITAYLEGYDIGRLWFSGDNALLKRLSGGGVERFKLMIHHRRPATWPALISNFVRLKQLIVIVACFSHNVVVHDVDISTIPRSVEHLVLDFQNAEACFLGVESPAYVDAAPDPDWSPRKVDNPKLVVVKDMLDNLRFMRLSGDSYLGNDFFKVLPESLLTLALWQNEHINNLDYLPPNLTALELPYATANNLPCDSLAQLNLLNLTDINFASYEPTTSYLSFLPHGTTRLVLRNFESSFQKRHMEQDGPTSETNLPLIIALTAHLAADELLLPKPLTYLDINYSTIPSVDVMKLLPRTLTHLNISKFGDAECLEHLPPKLRYFRVDGSRVLDFSLAALQNLPPNLTTLKFQAKTKPSLLSAEHLSLLPRSLTTLSYGITTKVPRSVMQIQALPPGLTRFSDGDYDLDCVRLLPRSLVKLHLQTFTADADFHHLKSLTSLTGKRFQSGEAEAAAFVASLPSTLKTLLLTGEHPINADAILPPNLTYLNLLGCTTQFTDVFWKNLPPNLEELYLEDNLHITDEHCAWLPRYLLSLGSKTSHITDVGIKALPRTLKDIQLENITNVTNEGIRHLPRTATSLYFDSITGITDEAVALLPRTLVAVDLRKADLTAACLPFLPPLLDYFRSANDAVNKEFQLLDGDALAREALASVSGGIRFYNPKR